MTTRHLIGLITGVLIMAILLPILLSIWLAQREAHRQFITEQETYASRVLIRTEQVMDQAKGALRQMDTLKDTGCSPAHLQEMRRLSYSWRYIQEVLYLDGLTTRCSSLENAGKPFTFPEPDRIIPSGYRAWYTERNDLGIHRYMAAFASDHHMVIIDPVSFIDVIPFSNSKTQVALISTHNSRVLASSAPLDQHAWQQIQLQHLETLTKDNVVYTVRQYPDLQVSIMTWSSTLPLSERLRHQLLLWVPAGMLLSLLASWLIFQVLRRLQSPRQRMLDALNNAGITVDYQPIVSLADGKVVGCEALARWKQPDGSYLSPEIFIPLAEQTGLITHLTENVVKSVFRDLGKWLSLHPDQHVSINLSVADFHSVMLQTLLHQQMRIWHVQPQQIALELTERGFADPKTTLPAMSAYRKAGHAIYIDDFGTGYSSLRYLQDLEVDTLKLDKSFVDALEYAQVTPYIIEMAKTLQLNVVAEGIESPCQEKWLREHGVQFGQGWLYSKALPKEAFIIWAENNLRAHATSDRT
ncbi:EAL domain-containing protein [Kluyvera sp. 142486]|uniref:EAL domain-containing protein n=1 Tax=Kluyvera sp. 142486 TaxID=3390050 RepID=UPI00397F4873